MVECNYQITGLIWRLVPGTEAPYFGKWRFHMNFEELFAQTKEKFIQTDVSSVSGKLAIQINLTGEAEGTFYIEVKDGKLSIEPYEYIDRDVAITVSSKNFQKIAAGKLDPVMAFTVGKLKVDGDVGKALELKRFI